MLALAKFKSETHRNVREKASMPQGIASLNLAFSAENTFYRETHLPAEALALPNHSAKRRLAKAGVPQKIDIRQQSDLDFQTALLG